MACVILLLVWLLAAASIAETTTNVVTRGNGHRGPQLRPRSMPSDFGANEVHTRDVSDQTADTYGGHGQAKVLRYSLKETPFNGTALRRRGRMASSDAALKERRAGVLDKRANWNWKHLEDYRGYLYFIESTLPASSSPKTLPTLSYGYRWKAG